MAETPIEHQAPARSVARAREGTWQHAALWAAAVCAVLLAGGILRFHGLDWDQPAGADAPLQMHPDERFLSMVAERADWPGVGGYFDSGKSPLNPYNQEETHSYVYGTFPLFLVKAAAAIDPGGPDSEYDAVVIWGRRITALFDTATIAVVFGLGTYLFGRRQGLAAAVLYALAVAPMQQAHFWTMDPYVTFFAALTLLLSSVSVDTEDGRKRVVLMAALGVAIGLGLASKVTAWPLALGPVLAIGLRMTMREWPGLALRWRGNSRPLPKGHWTYDVSFLSGAAVVAMLVFRVAQPYAFEGPHFWNMGLSDRWVDDIFGELDRQNGDINYPPFVQFASRTPFLWPLTNMIRWGMGPALGLTAWAALAAATYLMFKRRQMVFLLPVALCVAVFGFQGPRFVAFMRYFLPMYPALCVLAGWALLGLWQWGQGFSSGSVPWLRAGERFRPSARLARLAATGAVAAVFGFTALWALAFQAVYAAEHPRITASEWIYENVPAGSSLTVEFWDDAMPYPLPGHKWGQYPLVETYPYDTDSITKVEDLVYGKPSPDPLVEAGKGLDDADYVVLSSRRVRDSVTRLEREYPATVRYYELLESGELGFEKVAEFEVRPSLLGFEIDDSGADESFTVYDHPVVRIYRKTDAWDARRALDLLFAAHPERAIDLLPRQGRTNGLMFTPEEARTQQGGGTFSEIFDDDGWAAKAPALWWLLWLELCAFAAVPWVTWLFRALPDRGYGLSKLLGVAAVTLVTWLLVAWEVVHFSGGLAWAVFVAALASGVVLGVVRREALWRDFRRLWRTWLVMEAIFLVAFGFFLVLRYFNPDLWHHPQGGEKPMELAYLTAVARSTIMPPYDPWFGGGSMNYYYMGWFLLAVPMRALKLAPAIGFNLGVATYAGLAAVTAASTVHNLVAASHIARRGRRPWGRAAALAGVLGAVLFIGIGNLDGLHQWVERLQAVNTWDPGPADGVPVAGGAVTLVGGLWQAVFHGAELPVFDWWRSSRVHFGSWDITEFPYFTFLFADLHAHLMGLPFFGLVIALACAYVLTARRGLRAQETALAGVMGLALGFERTVHTWDLPTAALLVGGALSGGQALAAGRWDQRAWRLVGHGVLVTAFFVVPFIPFTRHFETFNTGLMKTVETTQPQQYFAHFGLFVVAAAGFLVVRYREEIDHRQGAGRNVVLAMFASWVELAAFGVFLAGLVAFSWQFHITVIVLSVVLEVLLLNLLWLDWRSGAKDPARMVVTALFALAFAIGAGVDIVRVKDDIDRMNTVFKFSLQAWQLFAAASAYAAWYILRALWHAEGWSFEPRRGRAVPAVLATITGAAFLVASLLYVTSATGPRQDARLTAGGEGLDGLAYMRDATFVEEIGPPDNRRLENLELGDDLVLIEWLQENVEGTPVITEAVGPLYHWTGRISWNTGLPAVIGWDWHQTQQRWDYSLLIQQRRVETAAFYQTADQAGAARYLRKYNVQYVIVGTEERAMATPFALDKLEKMAALAPVFEYRDYVIYRVDQGRLPPP